MGLLRHLGIALAAMVCACAPAADTDEVTGAEGLTTIRFATDWRAQAEH